MSPHIGLSTRLFLPITFITKQIAKSGNYLIYFSFFTSGNVNYFPDRFFVFVYLYSCVCYLGYKNKISGLIAVTFQNWLLPRQNLIYCNWYHGGVSSFILPRAISIKWSYCCNV